jgi:predicted AlkP superfamily pyrophosphatase or phosphodiesterase
MSEEFLPDYKGGSIANLMSSIASRFKTKMPYAQLRDLPSEELKSSKNIVLLVIDGLGYEYLKNKPNSFMAENIRNKITSVFLPTTACAVTTFVTGVPPQQHGLTGWFMNLKEIGVVSTTLLFRARIGGQSFSERGVEMKNIIQEKSFFSKIKTNSFSVYPSSIINSDFTNTTTLESKKVEYEDSNMEDLVNKILKTVKSSKKEKYIFGYWMDMDTTNHESGVDSKKSEIHFKKIDRQIERLANKLKGTDTTLVITADHGAINTPDKKIIKLEAHPKLKECLSLPLCGEGRVAYCYVHPAKIKIFESYIKTKLKRYCKMYKAEDMIKKNFYGLFEPNKKLFDRIGDYVLIMKKDYSLMDNLDGKRKFDAANHGGVSKEEIFVPLIVIRS